MIVDQETGVIIDGMHRYESLRSLGACRIPVIGVNYLSENEVKIAGWARTYILRRPLDADDPSVAGFAKRFHEIDVKRIGRSLVLFLRGDNTEKIYREIAFLEKDPLFLSNVDRIVFRPHISYSMLRKTHSIVIMPPPLSKEDVIRAGTEGKPFPPKSTRHITILKKLELRIRVKDLVR